MSSYRATGHPRIARLPKAFSRAVPHALALLIAGMGLQPAYSVGTITIGSGNSFGGDSAINSSVVVNAGGILTPGVPGMNNGVGTMPFAGTNSLTLNANSILDLDFSSAPSNDMVTLAGGSLTLATPVDVNVFQAATNLLYLTPGTYDIFSFASTANFIGSASNLQVINNTSNSTSYQFSLVDNGTSGPSMIVLQISAASSDFSWNGLAGNSDWGTSGNWVGNAVPGTAGDAITFGTASTSAGLVNLNAPQHAGSMTFDNSNSYTLAAGTGGKLFLDNATNTALVSVVTGSHVISADVELTSNTSISFASSTNSLSFTGTISNGTGNASASLSIVGPGKLLVTGANTYSGNTSIGAGATLQVGNNGTTGSLASGLILNSGSLILNRSDALTISGSIIGGGSIVQTGGTVTLTGTANALTGSTTVNAGTLIFGGSASHSVGGISGTGKVSIAAGASVISDGIQVNSWSIAGVHTIRTNGSASGTSVVSAFSIAGSPSSAGGWTGKLNLTNNALVLLNPDTSSKSTMLLTLQDQVASGKNGGTWNGFGITSSSAALNANTTLAVVDNAELGVAAFDGATGLDSNSIIVTQAVLGDVNLDGVVDFNDLLKVAQDFGQSGGWAAGNLTGQEPTINFGDLLLVAQHFGQSFPLVPEGVAASPAPEPGGLGILGAGITLLLGRRKGRSCRKNHLRK